MLVILYRRDARGTTHYYSLDDRQQSLFTPWTLTLSWGTSPDSPPRKQYQFASAGEKDSKIRFILSQKLKTHRVLYSYFTQGEHRFAHQLTAEEGPALRVHRKSHA